MLYLPQARHFLSGCSVVNESARNDPIRADDFTWGGRKRIGGAEAGIRSISTRRDAFASRIIKL